MKIIECPLNGPRNAQEFICGGEVIKEPRPDARPREWAEYIFFGENSAGISDEWWCHVPSSNWFIARRNRTSNEILATFSVDQYFGEGCDE